MGLSEDFISSLFTETSSKPGPQYEHHSCRLRKLTNHFKFKRPSLVKDCLRRLHFEECHCSTAALTEHKSVCLAAFVMLFALKDATPLLIHRHKMFYMD